MPAKLLFDENLSPRLPGLLADVFPGSTHVAPLGLARAADDAIWSHAAANGFAIVTKDDDFRQRSFLRGHPPKVIWLRLGNCSTAAIEAAMRARAEEVETFNADPQAALLVLRPLRP